jgi:UDP-2,3-diacylglucosamine pyrophosphatase LpxH
MPWGCGDRGISLLRHTESDYLYLVGDIVDGWRLRKNWYCPQEHNDVVQKLLRKARKGTDVTFIPGNHDEMLRDYTGMVFGGIKLAEDAIHTTADGRRLWVTHGDQFDAVVRYARWLALLGDWAYTSAQTVNYWFNVARRQFGFSYWSLSNYLKHKVKNAVQYIGQYEQAVAEEARRRAVDGVVCGHIHSAEIRDFDGVLYCNDGDWVESCTALVEHRNGQLEILNWAELRQLSFMARPAAPQPRRPARQPARLPAGAAARDRTAG